jgi:uncharacterized coiled-coil DUF342 family protein
MDWTLVEKLGASIIIAVFFFLILKWVLEQFKTELVENRKERKEYLQTLAEIRTEMSDHNARAKEFHCNVQAEHKQMIETLGRINGYKHE